MRAARIRREGLGRASGFLHVIKARYHTSLLCGVRSVLLLGLFRLGFADFLARFLLALRHYHSPAGNCPHRADTPFPPE